MSMVITLGFGWALLNTDHWKRIDRLRRILDTLHSSTTISNAKTSTKPAERLTSSPLDEETYGRFHVLLGLNDSESDAQHSKSGSFGYNVESPLETEPNENYKKPPVVRDDSLSDRLKLIVTLMVSILVVLGLPCSHSLNANISSRILTLLYPKYEITGKRLLRARCT